MIRCTKCGEIKSIDLFYKDRYSSKGHASACKICSLKKHKERYLANSDLIKAKVRQARANNLEIYRASDRKRYHSDENRLEKNRRWYAKNADKIKQRRIDHPDRVKAWCKKQDEKRRSTPSGRLNDNIRRGIGNALNGTKGERHWENLVGYTVDQLKRHLEKQFKDGMTWENYGPYWHIDHKIPKVAFNYETPEDSDFKRCWALKNLQPLLKYDNLSKNSKLTRPFQPSLTL